MTSKQIYELYSEASDYPDPDAFASAAGQVLDDHEIDQLRTLWHVANDPFKDLLKCMGLSQSECHRRFCIPLRTVQDWARETRKEAPYIRLMMAELTGIIDIRQV